MNLSKLFIVVAVLLFGAIGVAAFLKNKSDVTKNEVALMTLQAPIELELEPQLTTIQPVSVEEQTVKNESSVPALIEERGVSQQPFVVNEVAESEIGQDLVPLLFQKNSSLPIVETIQYKSRVPWKKGRAAWLVDYASHYKTSLHFILRSLNNGMVDYNTAKTMRDGQLFNVFRADTPFHFYLLADLSRCTMGLYYVLDDTKEQVLLKTYRIGLGRLDSSKTSGSLTPLGKYQLGNKIAMYQPKMKGRYKGSRIEMITVFGTRWIPFEKEIAHCSASAKGFGIHGTPWVYNEAHQLVDNTSSIGKYESDGCIRLSTSDVEELYSIITSSRPTIIEIVKDSMSAGYARK